MERKVLVEAVIELNEAGILDTKLDVKEGYVDLSKSFIKAVASIPNEVEEAGKIPDNVIDVYNDLVKEEKEKKEEPISVEKPPEPQKKEEATPKKTNPVKKVKPEKKSNPKKENKKEVKKEKEKTMKKSTKEKVEKKPVKEEAPKKEVKKGVKKESNAAKIDAILMKGGVTIEQIVAKVGSKPSSIRNHIQDLRNKGRKITNEDGKFSMKG